MVRTPRGRSGSRAEKKSHLTTSPVWGRMPKEGNFVAKGSTFYSPIAEVTQNRAGHNDDEVLCAIVLAGGEGKRLQPFIKSLGKGTLPKQYVNFIGSRSMLEHTLDRAEKLMPAARVLTV